MSQRRQDISTESNSLSTSSRHRSINRLPCHMLKKIPQHFSAYLDLVRFAAAVGVVLYHLKTNEVGPPAILRILPGIGHEFVVVFFVLSGYVIAAAVDKKPASLGDYALDRLARIYSVAVPTLLISTATALGMGLGTVGEAFTGLAANLTFVGQSWSANVIPPTNPAFWSLCYEVMYYALFGCAMYLRGGARVAACVAVAAIAGPKVLLLLPCWLAGVAAYHWRDFRPMKKLHGSGDWLPRAGRCVSCNDNVQARLSGGSVI